ERATACKATPEQLRAAAEHTSHGARYDVETAIRVFGHLCAGKCLRSHALSPTGWNRSRRYIDQERTDNRREELTMSDDLTPWTPGFGEDAIWVAGHKIDVSRTRLLISELWAAIDYANGKD